VREGLRAPTCIFPGKRVGWNQDGEERNSWVDLVTVPCVEGRIVTFEGSAMHAVPSPPYRWLLTTEEEEELCQCEEGDKYCDDDDDDYFDEHEDIERSVLLFNTWPDGEPGPKGVNGDYVTGALPEGIQLDDNDVKSLEARILAEWEKEYGKNAQRIRCNSRSEWKESLLVNNKDAPSDQGDLRIRLMGTTNRRLYSKKYSHLIGPVAALRKALDETSTVSVFHLKEAFL